MAKKKKERKNKISGLEITKMQLQYQHNGWQCGYGFHSSKKYSRKQKHKKDLMTYD